MNDQAPASNEGPFGFLVTCAIDFGSGVVARCVTDALDGIARKLDGLTDDGQLGMMDTTLSDLVTAVSDIATALRREKE